MRLGDVAAVAALPEAAREDLISTLVRVSALEMAVQVRTAEDSNDHIVVRARQFENYMKRG